MIASRLLRSFAPWLLALIAISVSARLQAPDQSIVDSAKNYETVSRSFEVKSWPRRTTTSFADQYSAQICIKQSNACGQLLTPSPSLRNGASYSCRLRLSPDQTFNRNRSFRATCKEPEQHAPGSKFIDVVGALRGRFAGNLRGINRDSIALVSGLAIGDDSGLSSDVKQQMRVVSLTHLTAVSGANCVMVLAILFWVAGTVGLSRHSRFLVSVAALAAYVTLVGPQPSVIRAGAMTVTVLAARALGRGLSPIRALLVAVAGILVIDPYAVLDVGFQLSLLATAALVVVAPSVLKSFAERMPRWLAAALAVAVSAQLACMPILLTLQPGIPTYSVLANLLVEPVVPIVTILGLLACIVVPLAPLLTQALTWMASLATNWILFVADWFSGLPGATQNWPVGVLGVLLAALVVALFVAKYRFALQNRLVTGALVTLLAAGTLFSGAAVVRSAFWLPSDWDVVACDVGQGDSLVVRSEEKVMVIDVGRYPKKVDGCLRRLGVSKIDLLVLTHYDQDHVGGLSGALHARQVVSSMVTSLPDDRAAADVSVQQLETAGHPAVRAEIGQTGELGKLRWQVLNPPHGGVGTEDFNDASVVFLISGAEYDLLTLADLGERGQMRIAQEFGAWAGRLHQGTPSGLRPLLLKVAHHGSADFYPELYEALHPDLALISVGKENRYGHPTQRALNALELSGTSILRTDLNGTIAVSVDKRQNLRVSGSGGS